METLKELLERVHYSEGVASLAIKHRDLAEEESEKLLVLLNLALDAMSKISEFALSEYDTVNEFNSVPREVLDLVRDTKEQIENKLIDLKINDI